MKHSASPSSLRLFRKAGVCTAVLLFATLVQPVWPQSPMGVVAKQVQGGAPSTADKNASNDQVSIADLKKRLSDAESELAAVSSPSRLASGAPPGTPADQLQRRALALRMIVFAHRQHISALAKLEELKKRAASEAKKLTTSDPSGPVSVLVADSMRAELQDNMLNQRSEETRLLILAALTESAKERLQKASEQQRLAQEALESASPAKQLRERWRRDLSALEARALGVYLESLLATQQSVDAAVAGYRATIELQKRKVFAAEKSMVFNKEDLDRLNSDIDERRAAVIKAMDLAARERDRYSIDVDAAVAAETTAGKRVVELELQVAEARKALTAAESALTKSESPDGLLQKVNPFRSRSEKAELDKRRRELAEKEKQLGNARIMARARERETQLAVERSHNAVQVVEAKNAELISLDAQRRFWELRFDAKEATAEGKFDRRTLGESGQRLLTVLNHGLDLLRSKLEIVVGQLSQQHVLLRTADRPEDVAFRNAMIELLQERQQVFLSAMTAMEDVRHLMLRWFEQDDLSTQDLTAGELTRNWYGLAQDGLKAAWNFELTSVVDTFVVDGRTVTGRRGITVAKVMEAVLIVVIGYVSIALLTRVLMGFAIRRGKMEETGARIARKWVLALTLVILLLLALDFVNIPLTAFAFLGGAIAIGAGFGMQTLLKNLISGVMLLLERPFKPRDTVEVGGIRGEVVDINVRSCTIRDVNGIETLVPNSTFLEQNVTNWTLSSHKVRYTLKIGVAYGTDVNVVRDLLLEMANRHKEVLEDPPPQVLFMDFGDNALMFDLLVWLEIGPGRRPGTVTLSDLRFMIDASFAKHGIKIPYPQRDIHLDADLPLSVRVLPEASGG